MPEVTITGYLRLYKYINLIVVITKNYILCLCPGPFSELD
jgi:hypothetical protein